ncbi:MAG: outer-membrane lipoprotein carrier protein LolA [Myxococcales bacterium]|nr:outer-membrane lipoprotein carrier protein LolA [Myxococcales bacterium]
MAAALSLLTCATPEHPGLSEAQAKDNVILSAAKAAKATDAGVKVAQPVDAGAKPADEAAAKAQDAGPAPTKSPAPAKPVDAGTAVGAPDAGVAKASPRPMAPEVKDLVDRMQAFYEKTQDFSASFQQVYTYKTFKRVSKSSGKVTYKKPALMRWEYETQDGKPSPRTFVLAGDRVYAFDPGAKLLTRAAISTNQLSASVTFLWGQGKLADEFSIATVACKDCKGTLLELTPLVPDPRFKRVKLEVDPKSAQVIRSIVIDPDGSENAITFLEMVTNTGVDEKTFKLAPPPGTQVQDFLPKQ